MPLLAAPNPAHPWFNTQIEEGPGEPERTGRRLGDRISIGEIVAYDLVQQYAAIKRPLQLDVRGQIDRFEFLVLQFVCTLHPDNLSGVSWFDFMVSFAYPTEVPRSARLLTQVSPVARVLTDVGAPPIAYDLYPSEVSDAVQTEHTVKISPELKFGEVATIAGEDAVTLKFQKLYPRISAHGRRDSEIYWRYMPGSDDSVPSGDKDMAVIVRRQRGIPVLGSIRVRGRGWRYGIVPDAGEREYWTFLF